MKEDFNKIINSAKNFSLTEEERKYILEQVTLKMKEDKSARPEPVATPYFAEPDYSFSGLLQYFQMRKLVPALLVIFVVFGGSTSIFASSALPGDFLYGVKINVNEKLEKMFARGPNASARVEVAQASERLREIEKLSVNGEVSMALKTQVKNNFNARANKIKKIVSEIKEDGDTHAAAELNAKFETTLRSHQLVLATLSQNEEVDETKDFSEITEVVNTHLDEVVKERSLDEYRITSSSDSLLIKEAAEKAREAARLKIEEVEKFINLQKEIDEAEKAKETKEAEEKKEETGVEEPVEIAPEATNTESMELMTLDVEEKSTGGLSIAKDEFVSGETNYDIGAYGNSYVMFRKALRRAEEALLVLASEKELKIDIEVLPEEEEVIDPVIETENSEELPPAGAEKPEDTEEGGEGEVMGESTEGGQILPDVEVDTQVDTTAKIELKK